MTERDSAPQPESQVDRFYASCWRCEATVVFLALHAIGKPSEVTDNMVVGRICTECVASFTAWWKDNDGNG